MKTKQSPTSSAGTIRLQPVQKQNPSPASPSPERSPSPGPVVTNLTGTDRLLALHRGTSVYPSDFDIGGLQPDTPAGTQPGEILGTIKDFFSSLSSGSVDLKVIAPQWRDDLARRLRYPVKTGDLPDVVRIGRINVEIDKAHASVRMEKGNGSAVGEIYLEKQGQRWYVSDLQADFTQLTKQQVRTQPFDPSEWKALIKE